MLIIAHRGSPFKAPEHSLAAFTIAVMEGANRIEMDLRVSRDGVIFVCHDAYTGRIGYPNLTLSESEASDLDQVRLENGEKLLRLSEVISWWQQLPSPSNSLRHVSLNLELKISSSQIITALSRLIEPLSPSDINSIIISSRHTSALIKCQQNQGLSQIPRAYLWESPSRKNLNTLTSQESSDQIPHEWLVIQQRMNMVGSQIIHPRAIDWESSLGWRAKAEGYLVYTWSAMMDQERQQQCSLWHHLYQLHVDGHCTNCPLEFSRFLRQKMIDNKINTNSHH
ncbi:MAG: glycerophosphodiester phosphodiesterase family protein [Proteobacteria bacterium]|nr:glycerophosphodiester phosphodiesterase family protein [Pseudomonadota bacterium]